MTRYLGAAGYGHYRIILAVLTLATVVAELGTSSIIAREFARPGADQERVLGNALGLRLVTVTIGVALAGAMAALLPFELNVALGVLVGGFGFVAMSLNAVLFVLFQQRLRQSGPVLAEAAGVLMLLALAWTLTLTRTGNGEIAFVVATAASSVLTVAISAIFATRLLRIRLLFEWAEWRRLLVPALPIAVTALLTLVYYRLDIVILGIVRPGTEVGLYGVPAKILDAIVGFTLLFTGLLMPLMARQVGGDVARFRQFFDLGTNTLAIGTGAALLVILLHAESIVTLIGGADFAAGGPALRVLGVMAMVVSIRFMAQQAATALDAQRRLVRGYVAAAIVGVAAYGTLIPHYGALGAALGLLAGETVVLVWILIVLRSHTLYLSAGVPLKVLASIGVSYLAWTRLEQHELPWAISALLAIVVYFLLLLAMRGLPRDVLHLMTLAKRA